MVLVSRAMRVDVLVQRLEHLLGQRIELLRAIERQRRRAAAILPPDQIAHSEAPPYDSTIRRRAPETTPPYRHNGWLRAWTKRQLRLLVGLLRVQHRDHADRSQFPLPSREIEGLLRGALRLGAGLERIGVRLQARAACRPHSGRRA